ncbi:MAG TPA: hypothetical protein VFF43_11410, partial [Caldimonas sp.]|nr:hypothetical protein [Caldimonas sp.]
MTEASAATSGRERAAWLVLLGVAIVAGAWLRWYQLGIQVLLDDEWHALHKLLVSNAADIATSFGYADHSIPLTLYYRFLWLHGGLSEWTIHFPMLVCGIALLALAPLALRRETSLAVRAAWVALLAISPLLVYHSRTARPYALTALLVPLAIVAFRRWWQADRAATRWAAAYVAATVLSGWLHATTLAFTLLPFAYHAVRSLVLARGGDRSGIGRAWRRLAALAVCTALALALVLAPPLL